MKQSEEWLQSLLNEKASHMHALVTWSKIHCRHMEQSVRSFHFAHNDSERGVLGMA